MSGLRFESRPSTIVKLMWDKLSEFLQEKNGKYSAARLGFLLTLLLVMGTWTYTSFKKTELQPVPDSLVTLVIGVGGLKTVQRFGEPKQLDAKPEVK